MSSGRCFIDGCVGKLFGKCECEGTILTCKEHVVEHVVKPSSKRHQILTLYFKPAEEIKQPIINKLSELKKDIKKYRIEAIIKANKIITNFKSEFGKYIDQINESEARCNKMIEILHRGEEILDIASEDEMESVLKLDSSDIQSYISEWKINEYLIDYKEINEAIKSTYKIPFKISIERAIKDEIESNSLSFFRHNSSNFATINLDTLQISSTVTLQTQDLIHAYTRNCILPDKSYFYCCNDHSSSGLTFIIDNDKKLKRLQNSKVNLRADPIFYNNFIYLIGGNNNLAERYDFKQDIWESLAPVPEKLNFYCSCNTLFRDSILLAGWYIQKIIIYSTSQNNYQEAPNLVLSADCYKLMLRGNNRIYLFEKGRNIFESAVNNIESWIQIGTNSIPANYNQSSVVRYKGCLYIVDYENKLWKFDLASKQAALVSTV